ncbi:MAG: flagellar hook-associated protein [Pseudomonadota bacterium]|jgi:flagellar hook-associated protein 1 FlgK
MGNGIFGIGTRALMANQAVMDTIAHNISNANTEGYSRQETKLATEGGRYTGAGFFGRGVRVETVDRATDANLIREANATSSVSAGDTARLEKLKQLEKVFPTGEAGLGYAASQLLNAFVDVANQPQDMSARQVVLARAEDYASRMRTAADQLNGLQDGVFSDLQNSAEQVNTLTTGIAQINQKIAATLGSGHQPNDLLDQRDQLINDLGKLVQINTVLADDQSMSVLLGGGQALVLGNQASKLAVTKDEFDPAQARLQLTSSNQTVKVNESTIGSGSISGLLKVQDGDIPSARNLLGQMAAALSWRVNQQQSFGLDLGKPPGSGAAIFTNPQSSMTVLPSINNTSSLTTPPVSLSIVDGRQLQAEDYTFQADPNAPGQYLMRRSSDPSTSFSVADGSVVDGFQIHISGAVPNEDRFVLRPVGNAARNLQAVMNKPIGIAASSPFVATINSANKGTATVASLSISSTPNAAVPPTSTSPIKILFTSANGNYDLESPPGTPISAGTWTPGSPISFNGFDLKLNGVPSTGDVINVAQTAYPGANNGNALALLNLRDEDLVGRSITDTNFDGLDDNGLAAAPGANITNAYSQVIGSIGVRVQGAQTNADISQSLASNAKEALTNKTGVNLDEEAARLIQFQQSYQAAAKILQIAQSVFDTLLQTAAR